MRIHRALLAAFLVALVASWGAYARTPVTLLYAANLRADSISAWTIGPDGRLDAVPGSPFPTGGKPTTLAADPEGRTLYVTEQTSCAIAGYRIGSNGTLTPLPNSPWALTCSPLGDLVDPSGRFLFASEGPPGNDVVTFLRHTDGTLRRRAVTALGSATQPAALACDAGGTHVFVADCSTCTLATFALGADGSLRAYGGRPAATGVFPQAIAVCSSSVDGSATSGSREFVYVPVASRNGLYGYSITAGREAVTPLEGSPFATGPDPSCAVISAGQTLYVSDYQTGRIAGYRIDPDNGQLTPLHGSPFPTGASSLRTMAVVPGRGLLYAADNVASRIHGFRIAPLTGRLVPLRGRPASADDSPVSLAVVRR